MKAVILDAQTLAPDDLDLSSITGLAFDWKLYDYCSPDQVAERIAGAEIVLTNKAPITAEQIEQNPQLKYIGVLATGTNNVDLHAAKEQAVVVTNIVKYGTASVVQHAWSLILALVTNQHAYTKAVKEGVWQQSRMFCLLDYPIVELYGKKLLIVGYGELGKAVASVARAFGMEVIVAQVPGSPSHNDAVQRLPLCEALPQADVVSLHCPLTEQTCDLLGARELAQMKPGALLINTARGGLVNEQALVDALRSGYLGGAGFDVLAQEPPITNLLLDSDVPNLIITPHCAWGSRESRQRLVNIAGDNLKAFLQGQVKNPVF